MESLVHIVSDRASEWQVEVRGVMEGITREGLTTVMRVYMAMEEGGNDHGSNG